MRLQLNFTHRDNTTTTESHIFDTLAEIEERLPGLVSDAGAMSVSARVGTGLNVFATEYGCSFENTNTDIFLAHRDR